MAKKLKVGDVIRGYRVTQVGGLALAVLNVALLVLAVRRRARGTAIAAALAVAVAAVCFAVTPSKERSDEAIYLANCLLAGASGLAALLALAAARAGRAAPLPAPARPAF